MTRRSIALAVIGILVLTAGAMAFVYVWTQPSSSGGSTLWWPPDAPSTTSSPTPGPPDVPTPAPETGPSPVSPAMVKTGAQPPAMPSDPQARSDRLLELRAQKRATAMDQLNAREAARRARLGLESK